MITRHEQLMRRWERAKFQIIKHLESGDSRQLALKKAGVGEGTHLRRCYNLDSDFKNIISRFILPRLSVYTKNDRPDIFEDYQRITKGLPPVDHAVIISNNPEKQK